MKPIFICCLYFIFFSCDQPGQITQAASSTEGSNLERPTVVPPQRDTSPPAQLVVIPSSLNYSWKARSENGERLINRISAPDGYKRITLEKGSFGEWLRYLPLLKPDAPVHLYNGSLKGNQSAQYAVVDMDVGKVDLQQCADAVMRLKAEYHYSNKEYESIHFNYTSGDEVSFDRWRKGSRPSVSGNSVRFLQNGRVSDDYKNFRAYLQQIFSYAGTASLSKEMKKKNLSEIKPGDVFIQGGFPGHAVIVLDVAINREGQKVFMIGQSYMPAQEFHVLKNPNNAELSPWYDAAIAEVLNTPEWSFKVEDLKSWKD